MIISFSGTSGSGKSTIISQIIKNGVFCGKKVIVREEDSFLTIRFLKTILGEKMFLKYKEEKFFKRKYNGIFYNLFSTLSHIFYPLIVYIEFLVEYIWYEIFFKKTVLIGDRFMYDYKISFKHVLGIDNKFVRMLYNHIPRLYLSFLIDIDLNTALLRNKNNIPGKITADELFHENVLSSYRRIAKHNKLLIINNSSDFKAVVEKISVFIRDKEKLLNLKKIAICGLDGTGKTTIAKKLENYANILNIKCIISHFYHENLLFKFLRKVGFYKSNKPEYIINQKRRERSMRESLKATPFYWALLRFFDSYIQYIFTIIFNNRRLIIFDRYFYDYLVSFRYLKIRWYSIFNNLIPPIKQKFLLESAPMISYKRKPESIKPFFIQCHQIYLEVAKEHCIEIISTDNKSPESILQDMLKKIQ